MKAVQFSRYGGSEVIEINKDVPMPMPAEGQVLVEVYAASLNRFELKLMEGYLKDKLPVEFPYRQGGDFSGVITEIGKGVTEFKVREEVYGTALIIAGGSGGMAEYTSANVVNIGLKPQKIDFVQASSLPLVGSSVLQAIEEHIKLQRGQKILIHGGAGGIGSLAIQLAKHIGAYVATTVSPDGTEFVKSLGADQVIDYKTQKFEEILIGFDSVYDTVGGVTTDNSFKVLKKGGILVSMLGKPKEKLAEKYGIKVIGQVTQTNNDHLERLSQLIDTDAIKPQVDKVFALEQAKAAFEYFQNGSPRGKVVVKIK